MSETKSRRTLYLIIIFILLLVNCIGLYFLITNKKESEAKDIKIEDLTQEYSSLQNDFQVQLAELEAMKGQNATLDSIIAVRETEIEANLAEISKWKSQSGNNYAQLQKAKSSLLQFEKDKLAFQTQLDSLFTANDELKQVKLNLEENLATEKEYTGKLEEEKEYLSGKFELGKLLDADELTASGIKLKNNGVEKEVDKLNKTDKVMVCYQTGVNKVREAGPVKMQLRIISPNGETMYVEGEGSGTLENKETGETIRYSKQAEFDYDNTNKKICIDWKQNISQEGQYTVEMYQEGYLVGETSFELN